MLYGLLNAFFGGWLSNVYIKESLILVILSFISTIYLLIFHNFNVNSMLSKYCYNVKHSISLLSAYINTSL